MGLLWGTIAQTCNNKKQKQEKMVQRHNIPEGTLLMIFKTYYDLYERKTFES